MGNLVRDPELRVTPTGLSVCRFSIACSRSVKSESGQKEETTFVDVDAFGKQGETIAKYFVKGKPIFIEGRLRLGEWQTNTGEKRSKLSVVLENFVFVGPNQASYGDSQSPSDEPQYEGKKSAQKASNDSMKSVSFDDTDEDVPF